MKLAFTIAAIAALHQAAETHAECDFGSNYTSYYNDSGYCSFDVGIGFIRNFSETNTISSGDANITTYTYRGENIAIWKIDDKDSTVQCYSNVSGEAIITSYSNGSMFQVETPFPVELNSNDTVADGVPLSSPGLYYFQEGRFEFWRINNGNNFYVTKAEGDITDLCEVLGGGEGAGDDAAPAPTPTPPTTEAPSSGQMAAVTIIPCVAAAILNYFFS